MFFGSQRQGPKLVKSLAACDPNSFSNFLLGSLQEHTPTLPFALLAQDSAFSASDIRQKRLAAREVSSVVWKPQFADMDRHAWRESEDPHVIQACIGILT